MLLSAISLETILKSQPISHSDSTLTAHHDHENTWFSSLLNSTILCLVRSLTVIFVSLCLWLLYVLQFCFSAPLTGQFLWVNSSAFGGPWVLSPWLRGSQGPCSLDMAVFLHPKQSGQYTIWLIERDKPQLALFSTDTLPRITGWALVLNTYLTLENNKTDGFE